MKKYVYLIAAFFIGSGMTIAQEMAKGHAAGHHHGFTLTKPGAYLANAFVWISVGIVVATLVLTLKYIFFPGEKDPNHIKNIVKDEGFE